MRTLLTMCTLVMSLCVAVPARAQLDAEVAGRMHFDAGQAFYQQKQWASALAEFKTGYDLTKRPGFLFNIAQTYKQMGDAVHAREACERLLAEDPQTPHRAKLDELLRTLDEEDKERHEALASATRQPAPVAAKPVYKRWWFWVALGGVAAVAATGIGLGVGLTQDAPTAPSVMTTEGTFRAF